MLCPRSRAWALVLATWGALPGLDLIPPVGAQTFATTGEGLNVGRFVLHPSVTLDFARNSNVFYESLDFPDSDIVSTGLLAIKPRLLVDLPLGESRIRWDYSPVYRDYRSDSAREPEADLGHFFDLEGLYKGGRALTMRVRDHLVRDTVELRELDQGGELIGLVPFSVHEVELEAALGLGARHGVSLIPRYASARFNERGEPSYVRYEKPGLEVRYDYALGLLTTFYGFYSYQKADYQRSEQSGVIEPDDVARTIGVGLRRTLSREVAASFMAGYRTLRVAGGSGRDFSGPVIDANASWQLNDTTRLEINARRQAYQSLFFNNNFYLNHFAGLRVIQQVGRSIYWQGGATYQSNRYADPLEIAGCDGVAPPPLCPSLGKRRRDRALNVEFGAGYQVLRTLRFFVGYNSEVRASNIDEARNGDTGDPFHYRVNRTFFRIEAGWL